MYTKHCHSFCKDVLKVLPIFKENLHCVQNWPKNEFGENLKCYPLVRRPLIEISILFNTCVHSTLPFWQKRIPENFSSFPGKVTLWLQKSPKIKHDKILKSYPLAKWQSIEISIPFHTCHSSCQDLLKVPLIFPENFHHVQN